MADKIDTIRLQDGTLVRHKISGYQGKIEGTTGIKSCFTRRGAALAMALAKEAFQYRVVVVGEAMRHIAPVEDLEILDEITEIVCVRCHTAFRTKPGLVNKAGGRCDCGGWICPGCLACQAVGEEPPKDGAPPCMKQRKRLVGKMAANKKEKSA